MSDLPNPPSPHDERYDSWVRAIAVTAAATALSDRSEGRSYGTVTTQALTVAQRFEAYIRTGRAH